MCGPALAAREASEFAETQTSAQRAGLERSWRMAISGVPMPSFPTVPPVVGRVLGVLRGPPASLALTMLARRVAQGHPGIVARLGDYADRSFALDPTDLPVVLLLRVDGGRPRIRVQRDATGADCRIAGRLSAILALVHGQVDGDALFFSRDLMVDGDIGAALALRNAIDDAELDLLEEVSDLAPPIARPLRSLAAMVERRTDVALHRVAEGL